MPGFEKPFTQIKKALGGNEYNSLVPSQLSNAVALRILSNGSPDLETFVDEFIRGRNVLEITGGSRTALVELLTNKYEARAAISTDIAERKWGARPDMFLQVDLNRLDDYVEEIRKRFSGDLPDMIFGTSSLGVPGLSHEETKRWLTGCSRIVAPGGVIIMDFLVYGDLSIASCIHGKPVTRKQFEAMLDELVVAGIVRCWQVGEKMNPATVYKAPFPSYRPPSWTYRIFPSWKAHVVRSDWIYSQTWLH